MQHNPFIVPTTSSLFQMPITQVPAAAAPAVAGAMYHQQHGNCGITLKYDATLYRWMRAQIGHIRQWKLKSQISTYRKHNETRYMSALQAIGINWVPK